MRVHFTSYTHAFALPTSRLATSLSVSLLSSAASVWFDNQFGALTSSLPFAFLASAKQRFVEAACLGEGPTHSNAYENCDFEFECGK